MGYPQPFLVPFPLPVHSVFSGQGTLEKVSTDERWEQGECYGSQCSQHSLPSVHLFRLSFPAFHVFMFPVFSSAYAQQFLYSRATMRNLNAVIAHAWLSIITPRGGQRVCDSIRVPSFPPVPVSPVFVVGELFPFQILGTPECSLISWVPSITFFVFLHVMFCHYSSSVPLVPV